MIADIALFVTLLGGIVVASRSLSAQRAELKGDIGKLRKEFKSEVGTLRTELKGDLGTLRAELGEVEQRLGRRIDAVRDELVATRVAMADRVARIEGRVFGVPLPGTGTDSA